MGPAPRHTVADKDLLPTETDVQLNTQREVEENFRTGKFYLKLNTKVAIVSVLIMLQYIFIGVETDDAAELAAVCTNDDGGSPLPQLPTTSPKQLT